MSIKFSNLVRERAEPKSITQRFVLFVLADYANELGVCWPSVNTITHDTQLSERCVRKATQDLVSGGFLEKSVGNVPGQRSNTYRILTGAEGARGAGVHAVQGARGAGVHAVQAEGARGAGGEVHAVQGMGAPGAPEPSLNPHIEPPMNPQPEPGAGIQTPAKAKLTAKSKRFPADHPEPIASRLLAVGALMRRRATSAWSVKELEAFRAAGLDAATEDDFHEQLEPMRAYYHAKIAGEKDYRRRDLQTLLNNWTGELDRARAWARDNNDGIQKL